MCQLGPIGAKSYFLPDHCHIRREGTFLDVLNSGEVRFSKIWLLDPFWPPFSSQVGPIGAKSYFLPNHCHIHREGTFLEVLNSGEVRFSKFWLLDPIWPPLQWPGGANWGQILFFAQSSPYSQGRDLFESFEQWWSQIFQRQVHGFLGKTLQLLSLI